MHATLPQFAKYFGNVCSTTLFEMAVGGVDYHYPSIPKINRTPYMGACKTEWYGHVVGRGEFGLGYCISTLVMFCNY